MKKLILVALFFGVTNLFAQQQDSILVKEIPTIKSNLLKQQQEIDALTKKLNSQNYTIGKQGQTISTLQTENKNLSTSIDSLSQLIQTNQQNIITNSEELGTKIQDTEKRADYQIAALDSNVEKNRLYWIIATLATLLLGGLIYWLLGKRISSSKTDVETQIRNTKASLEEESVKLDNKLVEVLTKQLEVIKSDQATKKVTNENDHSLVLKVADRLNSMEKNLSHMDPKIKGHKHLTMAVKNIKDNFAANGYEIVDMLGKEYNEGMKVSANFVPSEDLETGKQIITRIIKPQVNFKGEMIQAAQIEVSVGE